MGLTSGAWGDPGVLDDGFVTPLGSVEWGTFLPEHQVTGRRPVVDEMLAMVGQMHR